MAHRPTKPLHSAQLRMCSVENLKQISKNRPFQCVPLSQENLHKAVSFNWVYDISWFRLNPQRISLNKFQERTSSRRQINPAYKLRLSLLTNLFLVVLLILIWYALFVCKNVRYLYDILRIIEKIVQNKLNCSQFIQKFYWKTLNKTFYVFIV